VTALVFVLPIAIWGVLARVREDLALFLLLLAVELPFRLWRALGVSVGRHTDFWGWPNPNAVGMALVVITDVLVWYVVASLAAVGWRRVWRLPY
jgi:hypothetical protein